MSVICFPSLDTVRLALAGRAVPPAVSHSPTRVGIAGDGRVWLQPATPIPGRSVAALTRLGASISPGSEIELIEEVGSWLELVPLVPAAVEPDDRPSPVLFDLPDASDLPRIVADARRLGAGKISVRWLTPVSPRGERSKLSARAQVLVEAPPYHSLLHVAPRAYAEQSPRIWVEVGWRHPLAEMIDPPAAHVALIRAPRQWEVVPDGPFQSGPETFLLSERSAPADGGADLRLPISVRLVAGRPDDPPELWVLHDRPLDQLRAFAHQTDDRLLARLSVAVGTANGRQIAVLRAKQGRGGAPVLVLDALPCRPYLRLPNLYLPVGQRLRPPLRRDAVRQLFAQDTEAVVWLELGESGTFTIHTLPEAAFRPLAEAITYVQDHEPQPLTPRVAEHMFALPPFVVRDLVAPPVRRQPVRPTVEPAASAPVAEQSGILSRIVRWFTPRPGEASVGHPTAEAGPADEPPRSLDAGEDQRRALEERLLVALNTPDGPDRAALWPELGRLYAALNRPGDAAICWLNALWEADGPPPQWGRGWLRAEARIARGTGSDADLRRWLTDPPTPVAVRAVAAAVGQQSPPSAVVESLDRVHRLVDEHEDWLPVRAAWLARLGLTRLNGGDVVGLARARDRLLVRLHDRGLSADLDVPAAVRFAGQGAGERVDAVRAWLTRARAPIHRWLGARPAATPAEGLTTGHDPRLQAFGMGTAAGPTRAYADLILAWGLARLGERGASQDLLTRARGVLGPLDAAHNFLLEAFATRIAQALEGRTVGPLPADSLTRLADLRGSDQMLMFKADRLRQFSRILEPAEQVWAFNEAWLDPQADGPTRDLAGLRYVTDRNELADRLLPLVASAGRDPDRLPGVLAVALDLAPRLGEDMASRMLELLLGAVGGWSFAGPPERVAAEVTAVERGLFVAAHFDRVPAVQQLLANLGRLLEAHHGGDPGDSRPVEDALLTLVGQGLRGLRRLGLRLEADRLLNRVGEWVAPGGAVTAERRRPQSWPLTLRRLLTLAGGWFYVGRDAAATDVLDEARRLLFSPGPAIEAVRRQQTDLACAYAAALGQAPVRLALNGVEELFARLPPLSDNLVTNTHYSLAKLRLVEAAVRSVVTDDFALGPAVRRWLDDDEYRVRRRIHRDTRALIGGG